MVNTVTIYGASSSKIDNHYIKTAYKLGTLLAHNNLTCINGGGNKGLMGAVTDGSTAAGGKVIGIIPQFMIDEGWVHSNLTETISTPDMHTRKQLMAQKSDACIALPGGIGTLEELLEIITWKQLGLYDKPIVILNTKGYYDHLFAMLEKATQESFIHQNHCSIWNTADTPEDALKVVLKQEEWFKNPLAFAAL